MAIGDEALLGRSAGAESEATVVKCDHMDRASPGRKAQETLIGERPVGRPEMTSVAMKVDHYIGIWI